MTTGARRTSPDPVRDATSWGHPKKWSWGGQKPQPAPPPTTPSSVSPFSSHRRLPAGCGTGGATSATATSTSPGEGEAAWEEGHWEHWGIPASPFRFPGASSVVPVPASRRYRCHRSQPRPRGALTARTCGSLPRHLGIPILGLGDLHHRPRGAFQHPQFDLLRMFSSTSRVRTPPSNPCGSPTLQPPQLCQGPEAAAGCGGKKTIPQPRGKPHFFGTPKIPLPGNFGWRRVWGFPPHPCSNLKNQSRGWGGWEKKGKMRLFLLP